ncbi:coiled coils domain protein [Pacmanvirus S19]|nr:coiled coils domain protein [Pacmanvirus S19]
MEANLVLKAKQTIECIIKSDKMINFPLPVTEGKTITELIEFFREYRYVIPRYYHTTADGYISVKVLTSICKDLIDDLTMIRNSIPDNRDEFEKLQRKNKKLKQQLKEIRALLNTKKEDEESSDEDSDRIVDDFFN